MPTRERKGIYFKKMSTLLDTYSKILIVHADHVSSQQLHQIRTALRNKAELLMGKNTLMRKVVTSTSSSGANKQIDALLPLLRGNIGLIFTNSDFSDIRKVIAENKVPAAAKAGGFAECDVIVPPGPTGCDPGQTQWFQALNVPTKISKGQIEIVSELKLVKAGERVTQSEAALLQKLNIRPFTYGLVLKHVYDSGSVFSAKVLDITRADLQSKFTRALRRFAAVSLASGLPNEVSLPHSIGRNIKRLIAVSAEIGVYFDEMSEWKKLLSLSPEELAKLKQQSAAAGGGGGGGAAAQEEAAPEKKEEEAEDVALGGNDLFGGGDEGGY